MHSSVHQFAGHTKYVGVHHIDWFHAAKWWFFMDLALAHGFFLFGDNFSNQISLMGKCVKPQQCLLRTSAVNINDLQGAVVLDPLDPSFGSLLHACTFANLRHLGPKKKQHMDPRSQLFCWRCFSKSQLKPIFSGVWNQDRVARIMNH